MDWRDDGFVLATRRHGESALIVELLTREHGRHAGLVRGGQSPRRRALLQPGNAVSAVWRGRLPEHLGMLDCELTEPHAARLLDDPDRLAALNSAVALLVSALPEREPHTDLYRSFSGLLAALTPASAVMAGRVPAIHVDARHKAGHDDQLVNRRATETFLRNSPADWAQAYVAWECDLLAALGFGLDLERCAASGTNQDLAYVSPRTGRAVSRDAGLPYHDRLLPLPAFLWRDSPAGPDDIVAGLVLTRHFLLHHVLESHGAAGRLPEACERLLDRMRRHAASGIIGHS